MAQTAPPSISASPTAPQRGDRTTFSARVDAFVTWLAAAVTQFAAVATNVYNNAVDAYNSAVAGAASAVAALGSANAASATSAALVISGAAAVAAAAAIAGAAAWVSDTTYTLGYCVWSPINYQTYRRAVAGAGTTDPSLDPTNWAALGASGLTVVTVTGTTQAMTAGNHYVLTNVAATTATLPATPSSGDTVAVTVANALTSNVIARNAQTIMEVAADMTIDSLYATVTLRFLSSSWRLI